MAILILFFYFFTCQMGKLPVHINQPFTLNRIYSFPQEIKSIIIFNVALIYPSERLCPFKGRHMAYFKKVGITLE